MRIGPRPRRTTWAFASLVAVLAACTAEVPAAVRESSPAVQGVRPGSSDRPGPGGSGGNDPAGPGETAPTIEPDPVGSPGSFSTAREDGAQRPDLWMAARPARLRGPSDTLRLSLKRVLRGKITPKSVVASGRGLVVAQNMIYTHTVTAYDARSLSLVKTIRDTVVPAKYGFTRYRKAVRGGPVEAAFSPDGTSLYVSNYSMYGPGFRRPGNDVCSPEEHRDPSFVYRIDVASLRVRQLVSVGAVPKFLAVSPDGRRLLVSNWCSYNVSAVDTRTGKEIRKVRVGRYPRGIAVTKDSRYAFVAVMGSDRIARISLSTLDVDYLPPVGSGPRHLLLSSNGKFLFVTLNGEGRVVKLDLSTGRAVDGLRTGQEPRTMAMAADGRTLYVVNYGSSTVSAVRASDLAVVQTVRTARHPIGITYDPATGRVWVACYGGELMVFSVVR